MRIETGKRVARALLAVLIAAGQTTSAVATERGPDVRMAAHEARPPSTDVSTVPLFATAPATAASCASAVSCGGGCVAELSTGFCILAVRWTGGARIGGVQLGPTIRAECHICECWYTYTNSNGDKIFKRTTDLDCDASIGDLHVV